MFKDREDETGFFDLKPNNSVTSMNAVHKNRATMVVPSRK